MLSVSSLAASAFVPSPLAARPAPVQGSSSIVMETVEDLKVLAGKCNPNVGYFNPLGLGDGYNFWGESEEATIGFLRQAEIKHGRVAMAAFVGFIVQENDIVFPWKQSLDGTTFADIAAAGGPAAQWDALPINAKAQIFFAIRCVGGRATQPILAGGQLASHHGPLLLTNLPQPPRATFVHMRMTSPTHPCCACAHAHANWNRPAPSLHTTSCAAATRCVHSFLEFWSEFDLALKAGGQKHYMRGGKPGYCAHCEHPRSGLTFHSHPAAHGWRGAERGRALVAAQSPSTLSWLLSPPNALVGAPARWPQSLNLAT